MRLLYIAIHECNNYCFIKNVGAMAGKKYIDLKENDYVEFYIYPNLSNGLPSLNEVKENVCRIVNQKSKNYLWHNEEFFLSPIHNNSSEFEEFNSGFFIFVLEIFY